MQAYGTYNKNDKKRLYSEQVGPTKYKIISLMLRSDLGRPIVYSSQMAGSL